MIIGYNYIISMNSRNRCIIHINLYEFDSTDIELVFYGKVEHIIIITITINDDQNILIYKDN